MPINFSDLAGGAGGNSGGGLVFYTVPANSFVSFSDDLFQGLQYTFDYLGNSMTAKLINASDGTVQRTITSDQTYTLNADVNEILISNENGTPETLERSNPFTNTDKSPDTTFDVIEIETTQSITLSKTYTAYVLGGGGAGGSVSATYGGGGGGGSGYLAVGQITPGTYTATIGSGASGPSAGAVNGGTGGASSIGAISAAGGSGGKYGRKYFGGNGGNGGSGGGGGGSSNNTYNVNGGGGGTNGNNGGGGGAQNTATARDGGNDQGVGGSAGSGSGVTEPIKLTFFSDGNYYRGGNGGGARANFSGSAGGAGTAPGEGGGGATSGNNYGDPAPGGAGANGKIILVEVV